jgi:predicted phosphohydrolase
MTHEMNVWAISDLHLSFARPERRERHAARWRDHVVRIEENWRDVVGVRDLVLLPGDLSMARSHRDLQPDLQWLGRLPGTKVLAPGNHDRWWNAVEAIRPLLRRSILAVDGDAVATCGVVVCGMRGLPPSSHEPEPAERLAHDRELEALQPALDQALGLRHSPDQPLYVLRHFPPFDAHGRPGPWVGRLEQARVTACVYGHLHGSSQWSVAVQGRVRGVRYACVAADAVGFRPLRIDTIADQ